MRLYDALQPYRNHNLRWPDNKTGQDRPWTYEELADVLQDGLKAEVIRMDPKLYLLDRERKRGVDRRPYPIVITVKIVDAPGRRHHELHGEAT